MDSTYAPQSPDLSSFSSPLKTNQPYNKNKNKNTSSYNYANPQSTSTATSSYAPRSPGIPSPSFNANPSQQGHLHAFSANRKLAFSTDGANDFAEYGTDTYMPPIPSLPPSHSDFHGQNLLQNPTPTAIMDPHSHSSGAYSRPHRQARNNIPSYSDDFEPPEQAYEQEQEQQYMSAPLQPQSQAQDQYHYAQLQQAQQPQTQQSMSSRGPRIKSDSLLPPTYIDPNPLNIEIRTKFPVARIKRIMQADEEVGKVAQVTPVAVSKALELFMIALVGGAAEKAKEKGSKKVTATHLKSVVLGSEQFDFLAEIVGRVPEVQEAASGEARRRGKGKEEGKEKESESSEEEKKPKKARGRRKKSDE